VELVILGSGSAEARAERGQAGYVVRDGTTQLAVDFGAGTLDRMIRAGLRPASSTALALTHVHPDHVTDLVAVLFETKHTAGPRTEPLVIYGPPAFTAVFDHLMAAFGQWCQGETYGVVPREVERDRIQVGSLVVETFPVRHSIPAIGFRISNPAGRTLVLTGDTGWDEDLVSNARGADLLVADASVVEGDGESHLDLPRVARLAREAGVPRLVLTHLSRSVDAVDALAVVRRSYGGEASKAEDLARYTI